MIQRICHIILLCLFCLQTGAQTLPINDNGVTTKYPFVSTVFNRIFNDANLEPFYNKLHLLKQDGQGRVSIVHIGDSHIQPDFLSSIVRDGLQEFFGSAGRGLIFPYKLAASNSPDDFVWTSHNSWQFNRIAHPEIQIRPGISGFVLSTNANEADLGLTLRGSGSQTQSFDRIKLFFDPSDTLTTWMASTASGDSIEWRSNAIDTQNHGELIFRGESEQLTLKSSSSNSSKSFYGVSLENGRPGVLYHTIGVNGARYDQYNIAEIFWDQLPALKADLYIISLGTNEAQRAAFAEAAFIRELETFLQKLRESSPNASILITSSPDSYKGRGSNRVLQQLNQSLDRYCNQHFIPFWDLYRITNGYGSAYSWARRGLMNRDRVHFTAEGYRLQGVLLYNALAKGYNIRTALHRQ